MITAVAAIIPIPISHGCYKERRKMPQKITQSIAKLLEDKSTVKVLATSDENGNPHAVVKQSIHADKDGNLVCLELLESSKSNKNMVRSIWFGRNVAVSIYGEDDISYQIKGRPVKAHVAGPVFRKYYTKVRETLEDADLAAVWIITPDEVIDQTFSARKSEEETARPYFKHLDKITRKEKKYV